MNAAEFVTRVLDPGLAYLAAMGGPPVTDLARQQLMTTCLQETDLHARYQNSPADTPGPARGWWQFEMNGGVAGVLEHRASKALALKVLADLNVVAKRPAVWRALEGHDQLATCFARLFLWTDPQVLPTNPDDGWACYLRVWRPGKPHPARWGGHWKTASGALAA